MPECPYWHSALQHCCEFGYDLIKKHGNKITSIKGKGFMIGIECLSDNGKIAEEALKNGLLLVPAANNVLRILPPLNIGKYEIEDAEQQGNSG